MKDFSKIEQWTPKRLRTLRNNLNNRLSAFKNSTVKSLSQSHMLYGLEETQCSELLERVNKVLVQHKKS